MSMNPGATVLPAASMTRAAGASIRRPIRAIVSPRTAMSPRYQGLPVPSTIRPFLMIRSYAGGWAPGAVAANARRTTKTHHHMPRTITRIVAADTSSPEQPVVKLQLHSAGDASPLPPQRAGKRALGAPGLTALLLPQIFPILHPTVHKTHGGGPALRSSRRSAGVPTARTVRRGADLRGASPPSVLRRTFTTGCSAAGARGARGALSPWRPLDQCGSRACFTLTNRSNALCRRGSRLRDHRERVRLQREREDLVHRLHRVELHVLTHVQRHLVQVGFVALGENDRRQAGGVRGEHLLLQTADR